VIFSFTSVGESATLELEGELDSLSVADLRPVISRLSDERPQKVSIDLSRLRLIDSSGVGALVAAFKAVRSYGGNLAVIGARDQPLSILRLLHLDRVLVRGSGN
jgi:anti-sigma B factor antagonist